MLSMEGTKLSEMKSCIAFHYHDAIISLQENVHLLLCATHDSEKREKTELQPLVRRRRNKTLFQ